MLKLAGFSIILKKVEDKKFSMRFLCTANRTVRQPMDQEKDQVGIRIGFMDGPTLQEGYHAQY